MICYRVCTLFALSPSLLEPLLHLELLPALRLAVLEHRRARRPAPPPSSLFFIASRSAGRRLPSAAARNGCAASAKTSAFTVVPQSGLAPAERSTSTAAALPLATAIESGVHPSSPFQRPSKRSSMSTHHTSCATPAGCRFHSDVSRRTTSAWPSRHATPRRLWPSSSRHAAIVTPAARPRASRRMRGPPPPERRRRPPRRARPECA